MFWASDDEGGAEMAVPGSASGDTDGSIAGFEGLPSFGLSAMGVSSDMTAGLALCQECNSSLGSPFLNVPVRTSIVDSPTLLFIL